ncbi:MAG: type I-C CRISPR-associated protein Cas5c [Syntrophobacterales bacterium]|jgi:CRISPR-associated protein Cas5d|nr:type I-C CRISPR-associated protein Cas5c [Syntrophobacterales bacterium]
MEARRNTVQFKVYGRYALFSDPITRPGGEKFSYQAPTYQALKGITESVYWKPTFIWYIDAVRVIKRIQTESKGIRPIKMNGGNDLAYYTYLRDVEYQVSAHFEWNVHRLDLVNDRDEHKHHNIARRCVEQGGRRDVFLGTRECQAYVEPCAFGEGEGFYDRYGLIDFGMMFHGFDYPDETGRNELGVRLWRQSMTDGVIEFEMPESVERRRVVREYGHGYSFKQFKEGENFSLELVQ